MSGARERLGSFEARTLTSGERAIAREMFGDERAFERATIVQLPPLGFGAMAPTSGKIIFSRWRAARDFAAASLHERGWFVHELTHVMQAARGLIMPLAKLGALGLASYRYVRAPERAFASYNIEQQAEIARHLYLARAGAPAADAPSLDELETLWRSR